MLNITNINKILTQVIIYDYNPLLITQNWNTINNVKLQQIAITNIRTVFKIYIPLRG